MPVALLFFWPNYVKIMFVFPNYATFENEEMIVAVNAIYAIA